MRKLFKRIASVFLIPLTRWYLRKERKYAYGGVTVKVFPGVFHPGFFYSTIFLADFLATQNIKEKTFLELGCGTGLLSVLASRAGAIVTASDLNTKAIDNTRFNAEQNFTDIHVVHSDLFDALTEKFDWIIINPPYYAQPVSDEETLAWNCGKNFEYFKKLFSQLKSHIHATSEVIMVLTLGCPLDRIFEIAAINGFEFRLIKEKNVLFDEKDFLYRIVTK